MSSALRSSSTAQLQPCEEEVASSQVGCFTITLLFCVCVCLLKCPTLEDLNLLDRVRSALLDINNPPPYLICEKNKCAALEAIAGGRGNCFCLFVSSTAKLHHVEPLTWPAHERVSAGQHGSKIRQHPFWLLGSNTKGIGKGSEQKRGKRMRQKGDTRVNEKLQDPGLVRWVSPIVFNHTNTRMWMKTVLFADYVFPGIVLKGHFSAAEYLSVTLQRSLTKCTGSMLQQQQKESL